MVLCACVLAMMSLLVDKKPVQLVLKRAVSPLKLVLGWCSEKIKFSHYVFKNDGRSYTLNSARLQESA